MSWSSRSTLAVFVGGRGAGGPCLRRPRPRRRRRCRRSPGRSRSPPTSYPFGAADHSSSPRTCRKVGYVEEEYLVSGKANVYTGRRPAPRSCARRTRRTRRACSSAGRRRPRASAATSSSRCSTRRTCSTSTSAGRCRTGSSCATATSGSASRDKPIAVEALKNFDPGALRLALVRQPAAARRPAQLPEPSHARRPAERALADDRGRAGLGHLQPGRRVAAQPRRDNPLATAATGTTGAARTAGTDVVKHVYGFGYSQTGGYLYDYINAIHPLAWRATAGSRSTTATSSAVAGGALRRRRADQPVRGHPAPRRSRRCSSPTPACRSSRSCRSRTTCSASPPAGRTATRRPTATATTRWPAPRTRRRTSSTTPPRRRTSSRPGAPCRR